MTVAAFGTATPPPTEDTGSGPGLAPTEQLLTEGGDARIALAPGQTANRYDCPPRPDAHLLAFGSSTASVISPAGFAAAGQLRRRLLRAGTPDVSDYARELQRIRGELIALCGLSGLAGLDVIFAASGTDLHLIASRLVAAPEPHATLVITVNAEETGSGVPAAAAGRHFDGCTALGRQVAAGTPLGRKPDVEIASVPIRQTDGTPRPRTEIDADVEALARQAVAAGWRVLLVLVDVSKTGMIAPGPDCAAALRRQWPDAVDVLVDACQFRIAPATLQAYLRQDFMVALTGSKFLTGPTFSGALFIPERIAARLRAAPLSSLSAYSCRADWPRGWSGTQMLDDAPNFGLLLRWEAALAELRAFRAVSEAELTDFFHAFALTIHARLRDDPCFESLPVAPLDRGTTVGTHGWDGIPTIFPFLLYRRGPGGGRQPLGREQSAQVYRLLQKDLAGTCEVPVAALRCQLGQPVICGERDGIPVSALRICASARLAVAASAGDRDMVIRQALSALDKAVLLASGMSL
jgi:hypothetical protein